MENLNDEHMIGKKESQIYLESTDRSKEMTVSVGEQDTQKNTESFSSDEEEVFVDVPESPIVQGREEIIKESEAQEKEENRKQSKRLKREPERYGFLNMTVVNNEAEEDFLTYHEAMNGPDRNHWKKAIDEELKSFEENCAWELTDATNSDTPVKCKWVFKKKCDVDGNIRYRARLVAKGYSQIPGVDYEETFSPVVRHSTLRLMFALSLKLGLDISHLDVTTAFLNGNLKEKIYMMKPEGYVPCNSEDKVLLLKKGYLWLKAVITCMV